MPSAPKPPCGPEQAPGVTDEPAPALIGNILGRLFLVYLALVIFGPAAFFVLYGIKCWLGIDIFPDRHLRDFFP